MIVKLKKTVIMLLCMIFSATLFCSCGKDKSNENNSASINESDEEKYNKEEYVARITVYKEYYEEIENDYYSVNGAILVHEDGMPYMVLCCKKEQDVDNYKIQLIDYEDGEVELNGEKDFYGGDRDCDIYLAFLDDRCIIEVDVIEGDTEYWEFVQDNLMAQKLNEDDVTEFVEDIERCGYVYDISEKPYEYLYTYEKGKLIGHNQDVDLGVTKIYDRKISIYNKESDITTVNKIAAQKLYDYMELSDEQKEYFVYPQINADGEEILIKDVVNIYSCEVLMPLSYHRWMNGVSFKQCLNELINEPIYRIEDLMIKELNFDWYNKYSEDISSVAEDRKAEALKAIEEQMPKYNPYSTDEELLKEYYRALNELLRDYEWLLPYETTNLATIVGMYDIKQALDQYDAYYGKHGDQKPLQYDFIFTSDEFKGATWKDITFNGSHEYPVLTLTKNGNTLSYSAFDSYVEFGENTEVKRAIETYVTNASNLDIDADRSYLEYAFVYIDEDDIPEMILSYYDYQYGGFTNEIYSYKSGELIKSELNPDQWIGGYLPKQNNIAIFEEDYFYEEDGTMYRDGKYTQYSIIGNDFKYVKDIELTDAYESVAFEDDIISALGKIYSLRNE